MNTLPAPASGSPSGRRQFITCAALAAAALATARAQTPGAPSQPAAPAPSPEVAAAVKAEQTRQLKRRARTLVNTLQPLVKRFGPGVLEEVKATTMAESRKRFTKLNLAKRDLSAVKELLWNGLDPRDYDIENVDDTPEKLSYRVKRCPHATAYREAGGPEIGFAMNCAWDYGFCEGVNPAIKFTRTKTLMSGDCCCNHCYELKQGAASHASLMKNAE